jgi:aminoglycoside 6-adenylyltransferase
MMELIMNMAKDDDRIRGVYLSGSRVDPNATHDKYSDFDIVYIVRDIRSFTCSDQWLDTFGERLIMQKPEDWYSHPYDYGSNEPFAYLMQFKDGNRIDLTLVDIENMQERINDGEPRVVLLDKDGIEGLHTIDTGDYYNIQRPEAEEFRDCCNEFWWLSLYAAKGLCRRELMYVKYFMERYEMDMFLKMLNWKIGIEHDFSVATGKCYKYFGRYLSEDDMDRFTNIFPNGSFEDIWSKLFEMCSFFHGIAIEVAAHFKFEYSRDEGENIMEYLKKLREENSAS